MSKYQYFAGKFIILIASILIGIPLGIVIGLIYFLRTSLTFPVSMYNLAVDKWERRVQIEKADIWTRHLARMERNKNLN
jgi:hypothetical protein|tara:strand:- start:385 stop:621 length:237 start_codon:yes stop_codon:yes gene_type:complete